MTRLRLLPALLLTLACATGGDGNRVTAGPRPSVGMSVAGPVHIDRTGEGPITLVVRITNTAPHPITVRRVRVQSWAMEQWAIDPAERYVVEKLDPGASARIELSGTAYRKSRTRFLGEPLTLRALVDYEVEGRRFREVVVERSVGGE